MLARLPDRVGAVADRRGESPGHHRAWPAAALTGLYHERWQHPQPGPVARRVRDLDRPAEVTVTCHDGTSYGGTYRLATTLLAGARRRLRR